MFFYLKFPQNIILDYNTQTNYNSTKYWVFSYLINEKSFFYIYNNFFVNNFFINKKYFVKNKAHPFSKKKINVYLSNRNVRNTNYFNSTKTALYKKIFINRFKVKNKELNTRNSIKTSYSYFLFKPKYDKSLILRMISNFSYFSNSEKINYFFSKSLFDIYFLRKEKIYTKLKYSRVPQYDIVSGGCAALLAGFLGFLICEKFGFELLDSGDFYILFMYVVFFIFFLRFSVRLSDVDLIGWEFFSLKWLISFYLLILKLLINFLNIFKKLIN